MTRAILLATLTTVLSGVVALELVGLRGGNAAATPLNAQSVSTQSADLQQAVSASGRVAVESWPDRTGAILARPLLSLTRRPSAKAAPDTGETVSNDLPRITGIVVMPTQRCVIFAAIGEGKPIVAREGGHVGIFLVQSIEPGNVTVSGPDGTRFLHLSFNSGTPNTVFKR